MLHRNVERMCCGCRGGWIAFLLFRVGLWGFDSSQTYHWVLHKQWFCYCSMRCGACWVYPASVVASYCTIVLGIGDRAWQCVKWCDILLSLLLVLLCLLYGFGIPNFVLRCLSWLGVFVQRGSIHCQGRGVLACVLMFPIRCKRWLILSLCLHLPWISWSITIWRLIYTHTPQKYSSYLHWTVLWIFQLGHCRLFLCVYLQW